MQAKRFGLRVQTGPYATITQIAINDEDNEVQHYQTNITGPTQTYYFSIDRTPEVNLGLVITAFATYVNSTKLENGVAWIYFGGR